VILLVNILLAVTVLAIKELVRILNVERVEGRIKGAPTVPMAVEKDDNEPLIDDIIVAVLTYPEVPRPLTVDATWVSRYAVETKLFRFAVETRFTKFWVETKLFRLAVDTKFTKLAVETKLARLGVETTPETLDT
jgi:hypothetical protein